MLEFKRWRKRLYRLVYFDSHEGLVVRFVFLSYPFQPGDFISGTSGLRTFDAVVTYSPFLFTQGNSLKLALLSTLTSLLRLVLPEGHPYPHLFSLTADALKALSDGLTQTHALATCVNFERALLEELGFGLDLDQCAVTGQKEDLAYISPKTGRAVCQASGLPYHANLLPLPDVFYNEGQDWAEALYVTGFFLQKHLVKELPFMREALVHCAETLG